MQFPTVYYFERSDTMNFIKHKWPWILLGGFILALFGLFINYRVLIALFTVFLLGTLLGKSMQSAVGLCPDIGCVLNVIFK